MFLKNLNKLLLLLIQSVVVVVSASYYQNEFSGYLFTTFSYNSWEWRSQADAQNWCKQNGSKLLAITNSSIQNATVAFINDARQQNQLTSNYIITDGRRASDNWRWINETSSSPLSIGGQNGGLAFSYVYLFTAASGYTLYATQPADRTTNYYYICEFAGQTSCGNGYQNGSQCFQSFNEAVTWFEARNRCLMRGGDLATFEFITTNDGLNSLSGAWINLFNRYWIGLRRQWWTWQSIESDVTYSQWADDEPKYWPNDNVDCVCLGTNDWKWKVYRCTDSAQIVCIRTSLSSSSVTDKMTPSRTVSTTISASLSSPTSNQWRPSTPNAVSMESVSVSSTTNQYSAPNASSEQHSSSMNGVNKALAIGLGVGLGGGLLLLAVLIIIVILLSRKGYISFPRKRTTPNTPHPFQPLPDVAVIYADIQKQYENSTADQSDPKTTIEYASLDIVNKTPSEDDFDSTSFAITDSRTNTLAPPGSINRSHSDDTQQYGQVFKKT